MELITAIYKTGGLDELIIVAALVATFILIRAHATRQNAESHAIETSSQLARDSTTRLNVREEAYRVLQEQHDKQGRELEKAYGLLTLSDTELAQCKISSDQLKQLLANQGQQLMEANETAVTQTLTITELRREIETLKHRLEE
jgi:hypothetical protein